jgi:2-keto-3-deoxy-L-rhamnonate aldolase RhmA
MVQIESFAAYHNLDEILAVPGVDCCFIGPADLSATMGHLGDLRHPEVVQVILDIIKRCRQADRPVAIAEGIDVAHIKRWLDAGINVVGCGSDMAFLQSGFAAFKTSVTEKLGIAFR